MRAEEIREMSEADINARIAELEEERFRLKFRSATEHARGSAAAARDPPGHRAAQDGAAREVIGMAEAATAAGRRDVRRRKASAERPSDHGRR